MSIYLTIGEQWRQYLAVLVARPARGGLAVRNTSRGARRGVARLLTACIGAIIVAVVDSEVLTESIVILSVLLAIPETRDSETSVGRPSDTERERSNACDNGLTSSSFERGRCGGDISLGSQVACSHTFGCKSNAEGSPSSVCSESDYDFGCCLGFTRSVRHG